MTTATTVGATSADSNADSSEYADEMPEASGFDYRKNRGGVDESMQSRQSSKRSNNGTAAAPTTTSDAIRLQHEEPLTPGHCDGHHNLGLELGYLPPDQRPSLPPELLVQLSDPGIQEHTEAAEALRANAQVRVTKVSKVARSMNVQFVRKFVKRATLRGKSGNVRGKPPRIPPGRTVHEDMEDDMYILEEIDDEDDEENLSQGSAAKSHASSTPSMQAKPLDEQKTEAIAPATAAAPASAALASPSASAAAASAPKSSFRVTVSEEVRRPMDSPGTLQKDVLDRRSFKKASSVKQPVDEAKDIPPDVVAATMEAGRKFLGAVDPHNMLQIQRWRRKKKHGDKKSRKSYVKGKVIDGRHELYTLSLAVMLGVRTSIAKTNSIITSGNARKILIPHDFMAEEKYEFAPKGSPNTPPHQLSHTFKFKDYAPLAFAYLRRMFGVNEFDFLLSVCGNANFIEFISNAKSGQFFFYSSDGKYMIKTMTNAESKFLRRILPHYFRHCTQHPNTLITRFLGMYRVKLYHLRRNVKFVIMNSVYHTDKYLQTFYDLKGSELGRAAKPGQDVLKDNDLRAKLPEDAMALHPEVRQRVRSQIVADCKFLSAMKIMDYSMLIGIHHIPPKQPETHGSIAKTGFRIRNERNSIRQTRKSGAIDPNTLYSLSKLDCDDHSHSSTEVSNGNRETPRGKSTSETGTSFDDMSADRKLSAQQGDSTRRLIMDIRESGSSISNFELNGLDEEDDCSYLEGADPRLHHEGCVRATRLYQQHPNFDEIERKKEQTVEQIYWPFHRFYDINGYRRVEPKPCFRCSSHPCKCEANKKLFDAWGIPDFVPPLSNRKDGGLMLDTSGLELPLKFKGPNGDKLYEGKIFYMGIIDILQQYNVRKRVETNYRKMERSGDPSCVHPDDYADRFIMFFDQYSQRLSGFKRKDENTPPDGEATAIEVKMNRDGQAEVNVTSTPKIDSNRFA